MLVSILLAAAAATAHAAAPHSTPKVDAAKARAEGYAEAQRALAGESGLTPDTLAANLAANQTAPASQAGTPIAPGGQLNLTCLGAGTANKTTAAVGWGSGRFSGFGGRTRFGGSSSSSALVLGTRQQGFEDQIDIRLFGGDDRIRLPRTMLPGIHGGQDGWFKLKDVTADAREIHASAAVSAFHNPKVYIDRVTGTISISGKDGDYSGECRAVQADAPARF
jgi:hypothetical protein